MYIKTVVLNAFWTTYFVNKLYDFDEEQYVFDGEQFMLCKKNQVMFLMKDQDMF